MSATIYRDILITMIIRRIENVAMYDDLAALGPRLRSFRLRWIARDFYRARALGLAISYTVVAPPPSIEPDTGAVVDGSDAAASGDATYKDIRITMKIRRVEDQEMYDDLASFGPRYRSFRLRSIAHDYYHARSRGLVPSYTISGPSAAADTDGAAEIDTSADAAILKAFGKTLGVNATA